MSINLHGFLASRADSVETPALDLTALVRQGEQRVRRSRRFAVAAVAALVAILVGTTTVVLDRIGDGSAQMEPAGPEPGTRALTYGIDQTIHVGNIELDTGIDFLSLDLTDDGAVFTTLPGGIWFTDGVTMERIGAKAGGVVDGTGVVWDGNGGRPRDWVRTDATGSLAAWTESSQDGLELVVYDSSRRATVARWRVPARYADPSVTTVEGVLDGSVFLQVSSDSLAPKSPLLRYDVASGDFELTRLEVYHGEQRDRPRALMANNADFGLIDGEDPVAIYSRDSRLDGLVDARTREPVAPSLPSQYANWALSLQFSQWLDDDRFVLFTSDGPGGMSFLVCHLSTDRCDLALEAPDSWPLPILPGDAGFGSERALLRAMRGT